MSDVDTWSPLDESNTSPPPDGWPEFMLPSAVNNSARAMMGAVRRLYDKQVDGSLVLPYLKLSGGTVTGNVTINGGLTTSAFTSGNISVATVTCSGNINASGAIAAANHVNAAGYWLAGASFATRSGNDTQILDNAGQWTFLTRSSAPENVYANTTHTFAARNNAATFATLNSAGLNLAVPLAAGAITASGIVSTAGIQANASGATAFYAPYGGIQIAGGASFGGTVSAGGFSTGGTVSGGTIASTGNINAAGSYTGGAFAGSSVNVSGEVRGGSLATSGVATVQSVMPLADNVGICGGSAAAWNVVESYAFINLSDAALKEDLGPLPDTLGLVAAIEPQAFRYGDDPIRHWGFVAQDVRAAIGDHPVDIVRGEEGRLGLDYAGLTAMLWRAVQSLAAKVQQLEESHV